MMNKNLFIILSQLMIGISACKKDQTDSTPPLLQLNLGGAYISDSSVLAIHNSITFSVHAEGLASNLTYFKVDVVSDEGTSTIYDEGMNTPVFDACNNGNLILAAYNPAVVNQKCKDALSGIISPFLLAYDKNGLITANLAA